MHPVLLARSLAAIQPGTTSLIQFQMRSGISSKSVAKSVLAFLGSNGIGGGGNIASNSTVITFDSSDKLRVAILAIKLGCDVALIAEQLSWKDFEKLASEVLLAFDYKTQTNIRITKPRMEIDVVGINSGFAIVIDCKHWKKNNLSSISAYARKQVARTKMLMLYEKTIVQSVPVILTLYSESVKFVNKIPIVPISHFKSFVTDVKDFLPEILVIEKTKIV